MSEAGNMQVACRVITYGGASTRHIYPKDQSPKGILREEVL